MTISTIIMLFSSDVIKDCATNECLSKKASFRTLRNKNTILILCYRDVYLGV